MRAAVNTLFAAGGGTDGLSLFWPYFQDADSIDDERQKLAEFSRTLGPEHAEKLKALREKVLAEAAERESKLGR